MRVNELSKELGKTNKEVLEILQKNQFDVKSHASSISDDQAAIVRRTLGAGHASQRAVTPVTETSKPGTGKAETKRVEEIRKEPVKAEIKEAETKAASDRTEGPAEPPKKRIAAVYRPQNSTQMRNNRPAGQSYGGSVLSSRAVYREPETRLRKDRFRLRACRVHRSRQPRSIDE